MACSGRFPGGCMTWRMTGPGVLRTASACVLSVCVGGAVLLTHQRAAAQAPGGTGAGGGVAADLFALLDTNKDGALTREEMRSTFDAWYTRWDAGKSNALTAEQLFLGVNAAFPAPP